MARGMVPSTLAVLFLVNPVSASSNFEFETGTLKSWYGNGFYVTTADSGGPSLSFGMCSSDIGNPSRKGLRRYRFIVPHGATTISFQAFCNYPEGVEPDDQLDIHLMYKKKVIPKYLKSDSGWERATGLLPRNDGQPREYFWEVSNYAGYTLEVVVMDHDERPGCYLFCSGFKILAGEDRETIAFNETMHQLQDDNELAPLQRFESTYFSCWSNANDIFTIRRLQNCDILYRLFYSHFRQRGFSLSQPPRKLRVVMFNSTLGFEAFIGEPMPPTITGIYHPKKNTLVLYDLHQNKLLAGLNKEALKRMKRIRRDREKIQFVRRIQRITGQLGDDNNLSTAMHEAAHHVSFNCGMLNRNGDVPIWLAEGLACYCESTDTGGWQGIGAPNTERVRALQRVVDGNGKWIQLRELIGSDAWRLDRRTITLGYSQSWALFYMLMKKQPHNMRKYLKRIYNRRSNRSRISDFAACFGTDLRHLQVAYFSYMRPLVNRYPPPEIR